ncbi:hypothetical protein [Sphingobacterium paucimobilis]|uniref:Uncharacterized protein n=1 Tax=Sphingobacterium paucimobilis HER1398 TaxID=1346330 RepID=U2IXA4_9SPHI|nr:hypothetical protein [Sphingobacterium paucimobilis]ERJ57339.1 hypothetical protein M472_01030 [Sphingobacterium paucimobilis HER1398]
MKPQRLCIYAQDVSNILGKSLSQSRRILTCIRDAYGKKDKQYVSIEEFAEYTGLAIEEVRKHCK